MEAHFSNIVLQQSIDKYGFVVLPKIEDEIVEELSAFYFGLKSPFEKGFHPSMFWEDVQLKKQISDTICQSLSQYCATYFKGYRLLYGNFMVKQSGAESRMKIHQDWSYVDEPGKESYAIWFPLLDLNEKNGALYMVPGSHRFKNYVRGPGTFCPFEPFEKELHHKFGHALFLKKGEPVVWQHRVLHYSPANNSEMPRVAVTAILVPENETVYHFYKDNSDNKISKFKVEDEFYFHYEIGKSPSKFVTLVKEFDEEKHSLSFHQISAVLKGENAHKWWQIFKK